MNIRDQRNADPLLDLSEPLRRFTHRNGHSDDVAARHLQSPDLVDGGVDIAGVRLGHGLDRDRGIPADLDASDLDLSGFSPWNHKITISCHYKEG